MPVLETITAALTLANTLAVLRTKKLDALSGQALTDEVLRQAANEEKAIEDTRAFALKLHDDADKVGRLFSGLADKIHDAVTS